VENKPADVTPTDEKKPEHIEREMLETRQSLTEKVAALEQAVVGNIHNVTQTVADVKDQVKETVESVKESVAGTVDTVKEKVMSAFDISSHVRQQPWAAVGISAAAGFLTGFLTASGTRPIPRRMSEASAPSGSMYAAPHHVSARTESDGGGWLHGIQGMMGGAFGGVLGDLASRAARELRTIGEQALDTALRSLKQKVETTVPHLVDSAVAGVVPGAATCPTTGAGNGPTYPPRM